VLPSCCRPKLPDEAEDEEEEDDADAAWGGSARKVDATENSVEVEDDTLETGGRITAAGLEAEAELDICVTLADLGTESDINEEDVFCLAFSFSSGLALEEDNDGVKVGRLEAGLQSPKHLAISRLREGPKKMVFSNLAGILCILHASTTCFSKTYT